MKASDARIGSIKEVLNVLRMIKQFGWEDEVCRTYRRKNVADGVSQMKRNVEERRNEELRWILRGKLYMIVNIFIK